MNPLRLLSALLLAAASLAAQAQAPALTTFAVGTPATTVTVSALATNLTTIWELVWGPDNFIWMTERGGRISRVNPTTGQVLPLLTLPDVTQTGESGLLGMVIDVPPTAPAGTYGVFMVYNYTDTGVLKEKMVRYTYANGTLSNPVVLLGNITATTNHSGSRLLIMPDRTLLMTTGDAAQQSEAQNVTSLNGKILRMNLDGTIPANNPTAGSRLYTFGHRNPQGLVQLPNGRIYSSEHGPNNDDEINKIEVGRNYGWPNVEGYCNLPAEMTFCAANNVREPLTTWTPTIGPSGLTYYDHPAIPGWRNSLLACSLVGRLLIQMPLNAAGDAITARTGFLGVTFGRLRAICVSPAGRVYIGTSNRDGRGNPTPTDDQILVLENRSFVSATQPNAALAAVALWPNPARQQVQVSLPATGGHLTVRDLLGRRLQEQNATGTSATLDLRGLATGQYLVEINTMAGSTTRRLTVQ